MTLSMVVIVLIIAALVWVWRWRDRQRSVADMSATVGVRRTTIEATVTRADGTVENLGVVSSSDGRLE